MYHNIERARRVLWYEPIVDMEEGVKGMFKVRSMSSLPLRAGHGTDRLFL